MTKASSHTDQPPTPYELVAIGGSAGSFPSMIDWIKYNRGPSIALVIHRSKDLKSNLIPLLQHYTTFKVIEPKDGEELRPNHVYVAPAGYHLTLDEHKYWRLLDTEPVWHCKPSIDILFTSLSENNTSKIAGILLSGANEDGGLGLKKMKDAGCLTLCIEPSVADYANMPLAAKKLDGVTRYFNPDEILALCMANFNA